VFNYPVYRFRRLIGHLGTFPNGNYTITLRQSSTSVNHTTGVAVVTNVDTPMPAIIGAYEGEFEHREDVEQTLVSVLIVGENLLDSNNAPLVPKLGDQVLIDSQYLRVLQVVPGYTGARLPSYELVCSI